MSFGLQFPNTCLCILRRIHYPPRHMNLRSYILPSIPLALFVVIGVACSSKPKTNEDVAESTDNLGKTLVMESIEAHGGKEAWYSAGLLQFRWRYHMSDLGPTAIVDTLQVIDPQGLNVVHEVPGGETRFGWNSGESWIMPKDASFSPPPKFWALTPIYFLGIPFVFDDPNARFELLPEVIPFEGNYFSQVKITFTAEAGDTPDDTYILLIDPVSKITRGAIYTVTSPLVAPDGPTDPKLITLDDLKSVGGVLLARVHRTYSIDDTLVGDQMRFTEVSEVEWLERGSVDLGIPEGALVIE